MSDPNSGWSAIDGRAIPSYQFLVTLDRGGGSGQKKSDIGTFWEVSGLSVSVDEFPITEGGQNQYTYRLPGRMTWPNLVLKRGITNSDVLLPWIMEVSGDGLGTKSNKISTATLALSLMDSKGIALRTWSFVGAWPLKWTGPQFAVNSGDSVAQEELEIVHHGFKVQPAT